MLTALIIAIVLALAFAVRGLQWRSRHADAAGELHKALNDGDDWHVTANLRAAKIAALEGEALAKDRKIEALTADLDQCQAEKAQLALAKDKGPVREQHKKTD